MPPIRMANGATPAITVSGAAAATTRKAMLVAPRALVLRCSAALDGGGAGGALEVAVDMAAFRGSGGERTELGGDPKTSKPKPIRFR